ncbi:sensor histidine kinase [Megalodesulfovibrio gigas]|uniref:histidine kinase n=1 Tax=Megalodesulfovibrio gigas (strain ATCC 19364 / DSM 1382 / NCIMB 9332 / VKM B-1759) TaxID=1121448 RepID=T2GC73_MEGG1|nr:HAMP domain-containing sensor histidine kinase [Megalodesulfovibrio gigas]AGW13903.1 putative multi-sensor signal transduction histidine kinase [Megalodesulfovibrio gigas DSM 1382 = ATCC 19364]
MQAGTRTLSFRMRMFISFGLLAIVCLAPMLVYFHSSMGVIAIQDAEDRARRDMRLLLWLLQQHGPFGVEEDLDAWCKAAGAQLGLRITYMEHGVVLTDSEIGSARLPFLEDHSSRPEVEQALKHGEGLAMRQSATLGKSLVYVARLVEPGLQGERGVLRLAIPLSQVQAQEGRLLQAINWLVPLSLGAMLLLGLWLSRSLAASILKFSCTALAIGNGDYSRRLYTSPGREFLPLQQSVNTMAEQIQATILGLAEQKGQLEALFNGLAEGVLLLDASGTVESWNNAFRQVFKDMPPKAGRHLLEITMEPALQHAVHRIVAGEIAAVTMALPRGDREYEVSITPFRDAHAVRKLVLVFRDVTEAHRLERVRRDFIANASHEMRTPLTTIAGYAETMLEQEPLDQTMARKFLGIIHKAAWRMAGCVDGMLALSRIEAGAWHADMASHSLAALLEEGVEEIRPNAERHAVQVTWHLEDDQMLVYADEEGFRTVLKNLLENAVRYSPAGGVVTVKASRAEDRVRIAVADQGPGVPSEIRGRVFERFFRAADQQGRRSGGAGLGLAICKHMVQSMGGTIRVEGSSRPDGQGATFVLELPSPQNGFEI